MSSFYDDASLVVIPSGYKTSKIYAEKPTDGSGDLTFTRASGATRVASNGLIEKVRTNLALYSEDQTNWTDQNQTSVTANSAANPLNGAVTADKVIPSTATDDHYRGLSMGSIIGEFTSSIYVKADGYSIIDYGVFNSTASNYPVRAVFDLSTQTITQINGSISSITSVGSGWYRISVTASVASTSTMSIYHRVRSTGTSGNYAGDGTSGMLLWGCQLESGVMTAYIGPTTTAAVSVGPVSNVPRLDYLGSSCPRLLLEPQRTNLLTFSEQINNAGWTKTNAPTITTNTATAPDGTISADGLQAADGANYKTIRQTFSLSANSTLTFSFFVKKETSETAFGGFYIYFQGGTDKIVYGIVNAVTGTVTYADSTLTATTKVESYGNYWRIASTATDTGSNTSCDIGYYGTLSTNGTSLNTGAGSVRTLWGFQAEVGAYATSYIPTLGASVTRVADAASKTGISSLIGQTEGVLFADINYNGNKDISGSIAIRVYTGTNEAYIFITNANLLQCELYNATLQCAITGAIGSNGRKKIAFAYKQNDFVVYMNGVQIGTDTSGTVGAMANVNVGSYDSPDYITLNGINQALLFKTRLTNAQLAELTTL
jgi:hypothetical protein